MWRKKEWLLLLFLIILSAVNVSGQSAPTNKYPSLFWEITGNGLTKPSYLFGTMHVSNKMVFHLSDSFYHAMKNVDAVALELNPDVWQGQMVRLDRVKQNYANYVRPPDEDYLTESSFRIDKYDEELKLAMGTEPTVVNSLLYRSYKAKEDFEEDTFLDLYIFQTGKKLGKRSAGVEDFYETEKIVLEAYADMATEKKKKTIDTDGESLRDITKKIQDAYRRGDLDLMDSLDIMTDRSDAFREKFLYKRNEIQAGSIDTIIKTSSLFVGVGAAHLPGPRGVIELLRKKGYHLRPVKMNDRDAEKKEETDKLKVPVFFTQQKADDGFYTVAMPGPLFKMTDDYQPLDRRQYSDMSNGSYYLVTRIKTRAAFLGQTEEEVMKKVDSMLYENIPGKILSKTFIEKNGYKGFDITNRTRRGDLQRYNIFITPFEVLLFKMSGKDNYVDGAEARQFFSSIAFKETASNPMVFTTGQGGFSVNFVSTPNVCADANESDGIDRWEYSAKDKATGDAYIILKKNVNNFKFLEEDSFDIKLMEASFRSAYFFDQQVQRKAASFNGYPCLDVKEKLKDGSFITARFIIKGPQYYAIAARSRTASKDFSTFFNSFHFTDVSYSAGKNYTDTFMHFTTVTPIMPELDNSYRAKLEQVSKEVASSRMYNAYGNNYWPKIRNAIFRSDSTSEMIAVAVQQYPQYYYVKEPAKFWTNQLNEYLDKTDFMLYSKDSFNMPGNVKGFKFTLRDSGSSRTINRVCLLQDNYLFTISSMGDTISGQSAFVSSFVKSFAPVPNKLGDNIFDNKLETFFNDFFSKDSTTAAKAQHAISDVYFGEKGVPIIMKALQKISTSDKNYLTHKAKFIAELGYIKDSVKPVVVDYLQKIYQQTADTGLFQNEVIKALARHKSIAAIKALKEIVLQDPPAFDKDYDYTALFNNLGDSMALAANLYPEILQLTTLQDYKEPVISLLAQLVDSGFIKGRVYKDYFTNIYFDAKILLRKQQGRDEIKMADDRKKDANDPEESMVVKNFNGNYRDAAENSELDNYAILLAPFYDSNANVHKFFDQLLKSNNDNIRMNTAVLLLRNNKPVADSIFTAFALKDVTRAMLFTKLEEAKRLDKFPLQYKTQIAIAKALLMDDKNYNNIDSVSFVAKQPAWYKQKKGTVYFFKYRIKKGDDWKMGISGLQPENVKDVTSNNKLCLMTDKKIKDDKPVLEQFQEQLKKLLFSFHKSAKNFYEADGTNYRYRKMMDYED